MIKDRRRNHQLIRFRSLEKAIDTRSNALCRSNNGTSQHRLGLNLFCRRPIHFNVIDWRPELASSAANNVGESLLRRREQTPGRGIRIGGDSRHTHHHIWSVQLRRWLELRTVNAERFVQMTEFWPPDVRDHARRLAEPAFVDPLSPMKRLR